MNYDVLVLGAGPAGCVAAIGCHLQGLTVLLLAGNPSAKKSTIESIHPGLEVPMAHLGLVHCIGAASLGTYRGIYAGGNFNALGADESGPWLGHHIDRRVFDAALLEAVKEKGIAVAHQYASAITSHRGRVTGAISENGCTFQASYTVDASGYRRIGARKLALAKEVYSGPLAVSTGIGKMPSGLSPGVAYFDASPIGWTWLAPLTDGHCAWTRLCIKGYSQVLKQTATHKHSETLSAANRRWSLCRPVCTEGLLLCGDAAAILDPAAGQGILNAITSATMAVQCITRCLAIPALESLYLAEYDNSLVSTYLYKVNQLKKYYREMGLEMGK